MAKLFSNRCSSSRSFDERPHPRRRYTRESGMTQWACPGPPSTASKPRIARRASKSGSMRCSTSWDRPTRRMPTPTWASDWRVAAEPHAGSSHAWRDGVDEIGRVWRYGMYVTDWSILWLTCRRYTPPPDYAVAATSMPSTSRPCASVIPITACCRHARRPFHIGLSG